MLESVLSAIFLYQTDFILSKKNSSFSDISLTEGVSPGCFEKLQRTYILKSFVRFDLLPEKLRKKFVTGKQSEHQLVL